MTTVPRYFKSKLKAHYFIAFSAEHIGYLESPILILWCLNLSNNNSNNEHAKSKNSPHCRHVETEYVSYKMLYLGRV